jgi:thiol:disulfide interchange protein DsbC
MKMRKVLVAVAAMVVIALLQGIAGAASLAEKPEAVFGKVFPQLKMDSFVESQIKGLYEVVSGQNVFYFYPEKELLLVGEIYTRGGQNITGDKKRILKAKASEEALKKLKDLQLTKAVKIGSGPKTVIEFTDPDCTYCRKASEALKGRSDLTRYIFLSPFAHPGAAPKVHYILNAKDQEKAYHEMMEGKGAPSPAPEYGKEIIDLAAEHLDIARSLGIEGTPTFFINGQQVVGADMQKIESLLKQ